MNDVQQERREDFEAAKGPFHDMRLHVASLCARIHTANAKWWVSLHTGQPVRRNVGELLMLCVSELAEAGEDSPQYSIVLMEIVKHLARAMEGDRKSKMDDKLPHRPMIEVELADALIRICDMAAGLGLDLGGAVAEKMEFNAAREDHQREHRLGEHGKKY